jgi:hypothetical protein
MPRQRPAPSPTAGAPPARLRDGEILLTQHRRLLRAQRRVVHGPEEGNKRVASGAAGRLCRPAGSRPLPPARAQPAGLSRPRSSGLGQDFPNRANDAAVVPMIELQAVAWVTATTDTSAASDGRHRVEHQHASTALEPIPGAHASRLPGSSRRSYDHGRPFGPRACRRPLDHPPPRHKRWDGARRRR